MLLINRKQSDPFFNIAAEEYFLKNFDDEFVMIWQNNPSVVIGKHQNTFAEINTSYLDEKNIPVIRRISGGGTVFHDDGNLNYSVITKSEKREQLVDFISFTTPIIEFLKSFELKAEFSGKNNLTINGKKFSGNSAHVHKKRVLHHGTLLFNSNLNVLEKAITPDDYKITDKAVKSVRAEVTNLSTLIKDSITITDFQNKFLSFIRSYYNITEEYELTEEDINNINKLVDTKYSKWEWNYGYSPSFTINNKIEKVSIVMEVEKGIIKTISIDGNLKSKNLVCKLLKGLPADKTQILNCFKSLAFSEKIKQRYLSLLGY